MRQEIDSKWARRKLKRARVHLNDLKRGAADWLNPAEHPLAIHLNDDGGTIDAVLELAEPPPLEEWALVVGDCVHNIRTALDVFVWTNSTERPPLERRQAAYPILDYREDDDEHEELPHCLDDQPAKIQREVLRKVAGLPQSLRSRVIGNMRWASWQDSDGGLGWHQRLPLIRELDDIDKHRIALELGVSPDSARWAVSAWDTVGHRVDVEVEWRVAREGMDLTRGEVVARGTPSAPVAEVTGGAAVSLGVGIRVLDLRLNMLETLEGFIEDVEDLLDVLCATNSEN